MYTQKRLDAQDVPLMESEKIKGGDSSPPVPYMLNEGCNPVLTTKNHKATEVITMSNVSEEGMEEEEEEEEEELTFLFVMDQEQIWDSLCNPVERETSEQLERGQRYPENWTGLSEGGTKFNIQDSRELSLNCRKEELTADDSQTAHQPSFFNSSTLAHIPTTPGSVTAGQVQTQALSVGFPQASSVYNTFLQTQHEETLRTNTFLTQEESTYECSRLSQDNSKCQFGRSQSSKLKSDEGHSLELETRYEKEKGLSVVIVADEMSSKMEGTGRIEPNPSTTDQKKVRELKEQREVVKSSANKPNSEFPEGSRISVEGIQTTSNGISSLLSSKKVNNHSDMGEKVEDLGQNGFICGELHLQEEEEEDRNSLKETKHAKSNRGCGELELAQLSKTAESEPAEMEAVELADAEEDQDWKEMENEMKIEQEKLLFGDDDQEEQEWDMQTQKTSKKGTDKETAAAPFMLGLDTLYSLDNDLTLSDIKENSPLVEAEEMTFPLKELFSLDSSLESACGLSECGAQTSVAKLMPFASSPAEDLNPVSNSTRAQSPNSTRAQSPVCYDSGQWEYSGIDDQAGSVSSSGQDCEQPTGEGRKSSTEEEGSENSGDGKCVRNVDNGGMAPFCRDLLLTPETQNRNDFQVMDHPVEDEIHISPSVSEVITVAGPLQKDACKRASDGTADYVVLHEGPDSIQELPKQNLPLPCQLDKVVCGEASVLGSDAVVWSVHKNDISSKDFREEGQHSVSEILQSILPGGALSNADEESVKPSLVGKDEQTWDRAPSQPQGHAVRYLNKFQKHLKPSVRNFAFSGKETEGDMLCKVQETESDHHNTDIPTSPNSDISIAADVTQLTKTVTPVSVSDQTRAAEPACSLFSQPSSPMLDGRHSVPPNGDFLAQPPVPDMDPKHPREILEHLPSSSQTCPFVGLKPVSTESSQSASAHEPLDQPPASESGFNQHCQLPDVVCHSEQSLSLECGDHQPVPMPILFKKHKHFLFPALNTNQSNQNLPSNQTGEAMAPELNTRLLPALATDPKNVPPPTFHSNKPPAPGGNRFAQQQAEATESNLPVHCREAHDHIQAGVPDASFISQTIPPALESQNFKQVLNTDSEVEGPSLVQLARLERASASRDQKDNIHEASSDLEVSLLGTHSDSVIFNNDASAVDATCSMTETTAKATDMHDGTTPSDHSSSVESQQMPEAAEVRDSTEPPPLLAFTNPIYFLQLGPPSPPTTRHTRRQQAVFHGSQWQQQQQTDNTKIDAGVTSASVMMQGVAEGTGKFRKGLEKPMVETTPAVVQRKEALAKHPPLEKSSSCPNKNAIRLDTKEPESNLRNKEALLKLRSKSKDWHRQGLRKVSIPTDNTLAEAIASLVPSKEEVPAYKEKREHLDQVTCGEKKPTETLENIKRRCSKLINSSELLYQKYSDDALNKAIQSQKRADSVSEDLELGYPSSPRLRRKVLHSQDSYLHRLSVSSSTSLWQDIPMVRGSTMLLSMTHEEQKLQEAKFELIASEASYLRSLNVAVDHFQCSQALQAVLNNQEKQWLFSRLQDVRDVSANFLFDLEEKLEENMFNFNVCDVALRHAPEFRRVYLPYVTNQTYQQQTFRRLLNDVPAFQQVLEKLESDPVCQRLSLKSFLILPFQRITRLKLLVQNILKRTPPGADEEMQATQAYDALEKLIKDCNENVQRMKSTEELIYLSQNMEFECKIFPLISQSRRLIKRGELTALEYNISLKWKLTTRPIYLHLFNDYLLLSRPRENGRFIVFDYAASADVRGEKCEMKLHGANKNVFRLFLLQNSQGKKVEFLFRTETQSEKLRWISALAPQQAETDLLDDSDAPQVQCVKPYKARENDELALEKADIIMVLQQSTDGWTEGVKLSDGERGWFPSEQVESISCRQARQINLKEQQRVKNAKQQVFRRK